MTEVQNTPEGLTEVKRFSPEQREALTKSGYAIYALQGESISSHVNSGRNFKLKWWLETKNEGNEFDNNPSMRSEVAINKKRNFLPRSNNKELAQQEEMIEKFSERLGERIPGVKAIIGQAPDYVAVAFKHQEATKEYLFGEKSNYGYTRTLTALDDFTNICVGNNDVDSGLDLIDDYDISAEYSEPSVNVSKKNNVYVTPLIVPI